MCLIYYTKKRSIIFFNLVDNKKITEIKKAHKKQIIFLGHYFNENNNRDLIISISSYNNNLKILNFNNLECIANIINIYNYGLVSACLMKYDYSIYILTINTGSFIQEAHIKVFDLNKKVKEMI